MASTLYARVAQRGFPVFDLSGQSGQGALQDSTTPDWTTGQPHATWTDPNQDPGSQPARTPPPEEYVLGLTLWGLPAMANPDNTPRTHAAPMADFTLPQDEYFAEVDATHAPTFTGPAERQNIPSQGHMRQTRWGGEGSTADTLEPVKGQLRSNAGLDAVQGYGGGGPGPGGVNDPQGPVTDLMEFSGTAYTNVFVSAAEVPRYDAVADQFIASPPEFGPWLGGGYNAPTANVSAQDTVTTDTPAQGPAVATGGALPAYATSFWG